MQNNKSSKQFIMAQDFFTIFPEAKIGLVVAKGISNEGESSQEIKLELEKANQVAKQFTQAEIFNENPVVAEWRQAYKKFKTKKGARCSIEAMLKRINSGNEIRSINPLVDIYNTVSLTYGLPCGGEDIDKFVGNMVLTIAKGDESFLPLGNDENEPPLPGEIIYRDEAGAICRCWNWREAQRTMLTEKTQNATLIIEYFDDSKNEEVQKALDALARAIEKHLGGSVETYWLDKTVCEIEL